MPTRIVALGASNLTRGLHTVVAAARDEYGRDVEIVAALGHGRSYGSESTILARTLPGILQSELWSALDRLPPASATRAIVSDIGNDILYGFSAAQILDWVHDAVVRLRRHTPHIVLAGLPPVEEQHISEAKFVLMRTVLFPRCRLSLADVAAAAAAVEQGLRQLAAAEQLRFVAMQREWYSFDPIHIRPSLWQPVWREILSGNAVRERRRLPPGEGIRLYCMRPERERLFGLERVTPQRGHALRRGGRVWLY
jgi:hypothetical protein